MRSQLRVRVILPVAVLGLLGAGFGAFASGGAPGDGAAQASLTPAPRHSTTTEPGKPAKQKNPGRSKPVALPAAKLLDRALRADRVVVVLFYAPGAAYDTIQTREARAGATEVGAGFVAVDVSREGTVASLANAYEVRDAPAVLVFKRGPEVAARISGYADRETVAQAAHNASA
jgi:hypothetical protein